MPTIEAVPARSGETPFWKDEAISLMVMPPSLKMTAVMPATRPITKNCEAISGTQRPPGDAPDDPDQHDQHLNQDELGAEGELLFRPRSSGQADRGSRRLPGA